MFKDFENVSWSEIMASKTKRTSDEKLYGVIHSMKYQNIERIKSIENSEDKTYGVIHSLDFEIDSSSEHMLYDEAMVKMTRCQSSKKL